MTFETLLAAVCTALSLSFVWPQVFRVYRSGSVEGISPFGTLHGVASTALWTIYGAVQGVVPVMVSNLTVGIAIVLIGLAQSRRGVLSLFRLVATGALCVTAGLAMAGVSAVLLGWVAIVVGSTSIIPQVLHVMRADDLSGVSPAMYVLLMATNAGWALYGLLIGDLLVTAPNAIVFPCSAYIFVRVLRAQRSGPVAAGPALAFAEG